MRCKDDLSTLRQPGEPSTRWRSAGARSRLSHSFNFHEVTHLPETPNEIKSPQIVYV